MKKSQFSIRNSNLAGKGDESVIPTLRQVLVLHICVTFFIYSLIHIHIPVHVW
jgi:hypothetical protein